MAHKIKEAKTNKHQVNNNITMGISNKKAIAQFIDEQNKTNQVVIYSKSYCPYCRATKQLFRRLPSVQVKVIELDQEDNGLQMQQVLVAKTGQRTVPNVFVNNQHVGGNDDVQQAFSDGTLMKLLEAHVIKSKTGETKPTEGKLRELIKKENNEHDVVIWSKSYCPYCRATKALFAQMEADVVVHEIDEMPNGDLLQKELELLTGQRAVPNVFVKGNPVGGNSDVQDMARNGTLRKLLK